MHRTSVCSLVAATVATLGLSAVASAQDAAATSTSTSTAPAAAPAGSNQYLDLGIGLHVSTAGFGVEVNKLIWSHLGIRADFNYFSLNLNRSVQNISYALKPKLENVPIVADLYPWGRGPFHLSGGFVINQNEFTLTGKPAAGEYTINHNTYGSSQVGSLTGKVAWPSGGGYAGLGFGTPARNSPLEFTFDLGAIISMPKFTLSASNAGGNAQLESDLQAQQAKSQTTFNKLKAYPVISMGLMYRL